MNIEAMKRRVDKLGKRKPKPLNAVQLIAPPEPDLTQYDDVDIVVIRRIVSPK